MMEAVRSYFTAIVAVCMIAVLANALIKHSGIQKVVRVICGLLVVLVVLKPVTSIDMDALSAQLLDLTGTALDLEEPQRSYQSQLRENIRRNTERYIQDRANSLGAYVQAEVKLSEEEYPVPIAVRIVGSLNYSQLTALQSYVTDSLGIAQENQEWEIYDAP